MPKINEQDYFVELRWEGVSPLYNDEPDRFVYPYRGEIGIYTNPKDDEPVRIGKFFAEYVDVAHAANCGESLYDCMDAHSGDISDYYELLYSGSEANGMLNERTAKMLALIPSQSNLLVIHRIELLPPYRGFGLGMVVIRHMIGRFGAGAGLIALQAYPLQLEKYHPPEEPQAWRNDMQMEQFNSDATKAKTGLRAYYQRLGFRRIEDTDFMVMAKDWLHTATDGTSAGPDNAGWRDAGQLPPNLVAPEDWQDFCSWAQESGYDESWLNRWDSRSLALQEAFLEEQRDADAHDKKGTT